MKETGLTGKRRSTTIAATPDDGTVRGKEEGANMQLVYLNDVCLKVINCLTYLIITVQLNTF